VEAHRVDHWGIRLCVTARSRVPRDRVAVRPEAFVTVHIATLIAVLFVLEMF